MTETLGYGDPECGVAGKCPIVANPELAYSCKLMVWYTKLEIAAAKAGEMNEAAFYEGKQNDLAIQLGCIPGFNRI